MRKRDQLKAMTFLYYEGLNMKAKKIESFCLSESEVNCQNSRFKRLSAKGSSRHSLYCCKRAEIKGRRKGKRKVFHFHICF